MSQRSGFLILALGWILLLFCWYTAIHAWFQGWQMVYLLEPLSITILTIGVLLIGGWAKLLVTYFVFHYAIVETMRPVQPIGLLCIPFLIAIAIGYIIAQIFRGEISRLGIALFFGLLGTICLAIYSPTTFSLIVNRTRSLTLILDLNEKLKIFLPISIGVVTLLYAWFRGASQ